MITPKQKALYLASRDPDIRDIYAYGSVQSGKTRGAAWAIGTKAVQEPDRYILAGFKMSSVWEIQVTALKWAADALGVKVKESRHKGVLQFGESVFRTAALMKSDGHQHLMGEGVRGIWFDEWSRLNQKCVSELLSRLSRPNAKGFYSTNPTAPGTTIADACLSPSPQAQAIHFHLDDNPFLAESYKEGLRRDYADIPHLFARYINGEFAAAEGLIWPVWTTTSEWDVDSRHVLVVDPAYHSTFAALWFKKSKDGKAWVAFDEYAFRAYLETPISDREHCHNLLDRYGRPSLIIYDTAMAHFGREMKVELERRYGRNHKTQVKKADKGPGRVVPGLRRTDQLLRDGRLLIGDHLVHTRRELAEYEWDESGDGPRKEHDDLCDCLRYAGTSKQLFMPTKPS